MAIPRLYIANNYCNQTVSKERNAKMQAYSITADRLYSA